MELQKGKENTFNLLHLKNGSQPQIMKGLKNLPQEQTLEFGIFFPTVFSLPFPSIFFFFFFFPYFPYWSYSCKLKALKAHLSSKNYLHVYVWAEKSSKKWGKKAGHIASQKFSFWSICRDYLSMEVCKDNCEEFNENISNVKMCHSPQSLTFTQGNSIEVCKCAKYIDPKDRIQLLRR